MAFDNPDAPSYRYTLLLCNCFLTFGSYFCFDMPTVLETHIQDQVVATWTSSVSTYYELFYTIYAWCNACMSLLAGHLVDKIGMRKSATLFLTLCLIGASVFALGASLKGSSGLTRYVIMFIGRFIFGLGGGSITIAQNAITAKWFKGRELAFAFGCTLTLSRVGSIVNYDSTSVMYKDFEKAHPGLGLGITLWVGAILVAVSYIFLWGFIWLDTKAEKLRPSLMLEDEDEGAGAGADDEQPLKSAAPAKEQRSVMADLRALPSTFWLVCIIITFFYNLVFPFMAVAVDFVHTQYGQHSTEWASTTSSSVYLVSLVVSPFLGAAVDYFGRRDYLALGGTMLSIPVFVMLMYSSVPPIVPLLLLGCCYSVCAAALWPTVQLIVPKRFVGRANGVATSMQMIGIGICNIITGTLKDNNKRKSPIAAPCCFNNNTFTYPDNACFTTDVGNDPMCHANKHGSCGGLGLDSEYSACVGTNYTPMLYFFIAMAVVAAVCAVYLKSLDRRERALYIGLRDKKRIYVEKTGREPETDDEMKEAERMARAVLGTASDDSDPLRKPMLG
eukprot:g6626.t1